MAKNTSTLDITAANLSRNDINESQNIELEEQTKTPGSTTNYRGNDSNKVQPDLSRNDYNRTKNPSSNDEEEYGGQGRRN
jgi:hypothetical protein